MKWSSQFKKDIRGLAWGKEWPDYWRAGSITLSEAFWMKCRQKLWGKNMSEATSYEGHSAMIWIKYLLVLLTGNKGIKLSWSVDILIFRSSKTSYQMVQLQEYLL